MKITGVTLTGVDDQVAPQMLRLLCREYRFVEWAFLRSKSRQCNEPRYPSPWHVNQWMYELSTFDTAIHLCGSWARESLDGPFFWAMEYPEEFRRASRIQINAQRELNPDGLANLVMISKRLAKTFVLQTSLFYMQFGLDVGDEGVWNDYDKAHIHFLVDASGGTGKELDLSEITSDTLGRMEGHHIGFAGGIGPDNVHQVLEHLAGIESTSTAFVDMESKIRTNDYLDLDKCRAVLEIAKEFID